MENSTGSPNDARIQLRPRSRLSWSNAFRCHQSSDVYSVDRQDEQINKARGSNMSPQGVPESCEGTLLQPGPKEMDSYPQAAVTLFTLIVPNSIPAMVWFTPSNNSSREMTKLSGCLALYWVLLNSSSEPLSGRLVC